MGIEIIELAHACTSVGDRLRIPPWLMRVHTVMDKSELHHTREYSAGPHIWAVMQRFRSVNRPPCG